MVECFFHNKVKSCVAIIAVFLIGFSAFAQKKGAGAVIVKETGKDSASDSSKDSLKNDKKKNYTQILKKASSSKGLFTVHLVENDYYFEIPLNLFNRDFLLVNKISSVPLAINEAGINKGMNYENKVIRFNLNKRSGTLWVNTIVPQVGSPENDAITRSVKDNFTGSVIENFKIEAYNSDSTTVLIKVNKVFDGTENSFNDVFNSIGLGGSPKSALSAIEVIKAFPENLVVRSLLTTNVTEGKTTMPVSITVTSNILLLPDKPMVPRFADARVGYFSTPRWYFSDEQHQMEKKELITRWRLEPAAADVAKYKGGELVEPKKPIIFYIDPATPPQWRSYIKDGIKDWQKTFEQAGFKNAIQAREVTDTADFDADDVRYSVVTYAASPKSNAMGPAVVDPRSGEILESDVIWWHNVMGSLQNWMRVQTGVIDEKARGNKFSDELMGNAIRFVSSHEIGHTLGLKHNMSASHAFPVDSLRSASFTRRMGGTASSIMDYARFNYIAQPGDNVTEITPQIGVYDKYAIAWGYRWLDTRDPHQEFETLSAWIRKHENDPLYHYGEQQSSMEVIDPRAQSEDLGDNNVKASYYGMENLKRLIPQILSWSAETDRNYYRAGRLYSAALGQWKTYMEHVLSNIGGFYLEKPVKGDGKDAYTPVPVSRQTAAFDFFSKALLPMPEWLFNKELLKKSFPLRDSPLGYFEDGPYSLRRAWQYDLMYNMLSDDRLLRMLETELMLGKENTFTASDLLEKTAEQVFKPTSKGQSLSILERMAQQNFVDALLVGSDKLLEKIAKKSISDEQGLGCSYMLEPAGSMVSSHNHNAASDQNEVPELRNFYFSAMSRTSDVGVIKRGQLIKTVSLLEKKSKTGDEITRSHYQDLILRIKQSLKMN